MGNVVAFVYGTLLGSFLNVCIFRIPRGTSIIFPPSSCPTCKEPIHPLQNIPIISYLWLLGKCHHCGTPIGLRYPLIECLTGFLTLFVWQQNAPQFVGLLHQSWINLSKTVILFLDQLLFVYLLLVISFIDLDYQLIFDSTSYLGIAAGLLYSALAHQLIPAILAAIIGGLFFYAVRVIGEFVFLKEAMGEGDIKLAMMLGAFLGLQKAALAILISFPIGILLALSLFALRLKNRKEHIPFGPAMAIGGFIAFFWGAQIFNFYLQLNNLNLG